MPTKEISAPRPSSEVQAQLERFKAELPDASSVPANDFAARLQWDAWQSHLKELEEELELAIDYELANNDVVFSLDGDPVQGHDVQAGFLGKVLASVQDLTNALTQSFGKTTSRAPIANTIMEESRLLVTGWYPSSFGVQLRFSTDEDLGRIRTFDKADVANKLSSLLDPAGATDEIQEVLRSSSRVRSHYAKLVGILSDNNADLRMRTPSHRQGIQLSASQARDRKEWLKSTVARTKDYHVEGRLTGGSTESNRFELALENGDLWKGDASHEAVEAMLDFKFNALVKAEVQETTEASEDLDDAGKVSYYLVRFESMQD